MGGLIFMSEKQLDNLVDTIHELDNKIRALTIHELDNKIRALYSDVYDLRRANDELRRRVSDLESKKRMPPF